MDFNLEVKRRRSIMTESYYTPAEIRAIQAFQLEVREWLDANIPKDLPRVRRGDPVPPEVEKWAVEFRKKLGRKGWLGATWPREYGGGGLTSTHGAIIQEELNSRSLPPIHGTLQGVIAIRAWGTEEQKEELLTPILQGDWTVAHMFTEAAAAGTDLQGTKTKAVRDGDFYVVNGAKDFVTSKLTPDLLLTLVDTNQEERPHRRFSILAIDAHSPGVLIKKQSLLVAGAEQSIFLTDVRVPLSRRIGEEGQGMEIARAVIDMERGMGLSIEKQREVEWREKEYWERKRN